MKKIALSGKYGLGKYALVDDENYEELNNNKWHCSPNGYALKRVKINKITKTIWMHRVVNKTPDDMLTDHVNGNRLDNRKENLRDCSAQQSIMNRRAYKENKVGYKGVTVQRNKHKNNIYTYIRAKICVNRKQIHLGFFDTVELAALAYNEAAKKHHGKFARLNEVKNA